MDVGQFNRRVPSNEATNLEGAYNMIGEYYKECRRNSLFENDMLANKVLPFLKY